MADTAPLSRHDVQHVHDSIEGLLHLGAPRCTACRHLDRGADSDSPGMGYWPDRVVHLVNPDGDTLRTR